MYVDKYHHQTTTSQTIFCYIYYLYVHVVMLYSTTTRCMYDVRYMYMHVHMYTYINHTFTCHAVRSYVGMSFKKRYYFCIWPVQCMSQRGCKVQVQYAPVTYWQYYLVRGNPPLCAYIIYTHYVIVKIQPVSEGVSDCVSDCGVVIDATNLFGYSIPSIFFSHHSFTHSLTHSLFLSVSLLYLLTRPCLLSRDCISSHGR